MTAQPFEPGTLWDHIVRQTDCALRDRVIFPIPTTAAFVERAGLRFLVRVVDNLDRKAKERPARPPLEPGVNPFLPYDERMYVADVSDTHVCLLNKFNVVDHHALVVTREYESQDDLLSSGDFHALWTCMREFPSLGFYNAGAAAGASQRHKHLQLVPLPLGPDGPDVPLAPALETPVADAPSCCPLLPFRHAVFRFGRPLGDVGDHAPSVLLEAYCALLDGVSLPRETSVAMPYNLLVTDRWMLVVPRSREHVLGMSINSLGYAGALLVRNQQELGCVEAEGPMTILTAAGFARDGSCP